jgi:hypothetical protein
MMLNFLDPSVLWASAANSDMHYGPLRQILFYATGHIVRFCNAPWDIVQDLVMRYGPCLFAKIWFPTVALLGKDLKGQSSEILILFFDIY